MSETKPSRELLFSVTDFEIQTFRAGGKGGQHQNKTDSGVRLIHHPSGARGESREERHQRMNKRSALVKLSKTPQFRFWVSQQVKAIEGRKTSEQIVDEMMKVVSDFKVEYKDADGKWVEVP